MRWFNCKKEEFVNVECINIKTDKHILRLSPNENFTSEDKNEDDIRFIPIYVNNKPDIKEIKKNLLSLQKEYDNSDEVNSFYINDKRVWFDKAIRVGLVNSINLEKNSGKTDTILWLNNSSITIDIDKALNILSNVEMYAKECYDNTHKHYSDIAKLETIEDCLSFDITSGYPNVFKIEI